MKRIQYHRYGGPPEMHLETYELPALKPGQVRVRVKAASLNPVDWKVRNGTMKLMTGKSFPRGMGSDFSGVVEAVGPSVTRLSVGDEVLGTASVKDSGTFAEVVTTDEKLVAKKPAALPFEQAACLPVAGVTAWRGLVDKAHLKAGQSVFVNGCAGGVGQAVVQLAQHLGASVAGSCGPGSVELARRMGVDPVLDYSTQSTTSLDRKFDVVYDTVGTMKLSECRALLKPGGVVLDINTSPGKVIQGLFTGHYKLVFGTQSADTLQSLATIAAEGKLTFDIGRTAPLDSAIALIADQEQGKRARGKAVIVMNA